MTPDSKEPTPGPWFVDGFDTTSVIANEGSLSHPQWKHVCRCDYGYAQPERYIELNKANAHIIQHTPYMIELLKQAATTFEILRLQGVLKDQLSIHEEIEILLNRIITRK